MPPDSDYTLAELASLAGVPPRTIRYYVAQGLLPSPEGAGPATRYPSAALARLKLVRQLQRGHLPLAEIRRRLADLTDDQALQLAATPEPVPPDSALEYVRSLLEPQVALEPPLAPEPQLQLEPPPRYRLQQPSLLRVALPTTFNEFPPPALPPPAPRPAPPIKPTTPSPERSQWERIVLEPDVELHVRRPLSRIANKRVDRLVAFARQLLEEETP